MGHRRRVLRLAGRWAAERRRRGSKRCAAPRASSKPLRPFATLSSAVAALCPCASLASAPWLPAPVVSRSSASTLPVPHASRRRRWKRRSFPLHRSSPIVNTGLGVEQASEAMATESAVTAITSAPPSNARYGFGAAPARLGSNRYTRSRPRAHLSTASCTSAPDLLDKVIARPSRSLSELRVCARVLRAEVSSRGVQAHARVGPPTKTATNRPPWVACRIAGACCVHASRSSASPMSCSEPTVPSTRVPRSSRSISAALPSPSSAGCCADCPGARGRSWAGVTIASKSPRLSTRGCWIWTVKEWPPDARLMATQAGAVVRPDAITRSGYGGVSM
mmetsp:Transcript_8895/g.20417  ORF Transcript_8895/g.20417 Transcript_8895/m.20417 type:complete len:335 (-) Transcript_8895:647-1651(-)